MQAEDAQAAGRLCVLPLLLQAVLPHCGQAAVMDMLRTLCRESPQGPAWAVDHPQVRLCYRWQAALCRRSWKRTCLWLVPP